MNHNLYAAVTEYFTKAMPDATTELKFGNPFQLLVAVRLSAQCTDKRINMITPALFEHFPDAETMSKASFEEVLKYTKSVSYPNSKTRDIIAAAKKIVEDFNGELPKTVEDLETLPGVGRKTANVVASVLYGAEVMPVDTHVFRVSARIGLTQNAKNPKQAEEQLEKGFPPSVIGRAHHWLILHGRYVCTARNPKCGECGITEVCKYFNDNKK